MAKQHLSNKDLKSVLWFRKYRDEYKAAERVGIPKNQAKKHFGRIDIQEEIERQDSVVDRERARVQVEAEGISKNLLDTELMQLILLDPKKNASAKLDALKLGYVRAGVLQVGSTRSLDLAPTTSEDEDAPRPTIYQAFIPVGIPVEASPILPESPVVQPAVSARTPLQEAVRNLTTRKPEPAVAPAVPVSTTIKTGKIKIG